MTVIHNHCIKCIFNSKNCSHMIPVVNNYFFNNKYPFHVYKKKIFFLRIAQYYMVLGGFFNSLIGCFATIDNPCINI